MPTCFQGQVESHRAGLLLSQEDNNSDVASHFASANPSRRSHHRQYDHAIKRLCPGRPKLGDTAHRKGGLRYTTKRKCLRSRTTARREYHADLTRANMVALASHRAERKSVVRREAAGHIRAGHESMFYLSRLAGSLGGGTLA